MRCTAIVLAAGLLGATAATAQSEYCPEMVGTYLTTKIDKSGVDKGVEGRTILTLFADGLAMSSDSAQGGITGYQAFGVMQGAWTCSGEKGFDATMVDFAYPDSTDPEAKIARVEIAGIIEIGGKITGLAAVNIYPLFTDPFSGVAPELTVDYRFEGARVSVTKPK